MFYFRLLDSETITIIWLANCLQILRGGSTRLVVVAGLSKRVTEGLSYRGGKRVPLFFRFLYKIQFLKFDRKNQKLLGFFEKCLFSWFIDRFSTSFKFKFQILNEKVWSDWFFCLSNSISGLSPDFFCFNFF
jgi:hypothetical protein